MTQVPQPADPLPPIPPPAELERPLQPPPPRRRRRRLLIGILVIVVLLIALVAAAPTLVATGPVTGWLVGLVNNRIRGTLALDDLSLSWSGPLELHGLRVRDPEQREVLRVDQARVSAGVWGLVRDYAQFGEVRIDAPRAWLYVGPDQQVSLARAFELRQPSPPKPQEPLPELRGRLLIRDGRVQVTRAGGDPLEVSGVEGQLDLDRLENITSRIELTVAGGGRLTADAAVRGLDLNGPRALGRANGTVQVRTDGPLNLAPLAALAAPELEMQGTAALDLNAELQNGDVQAALTADVAGLQTRGRAAQAPPIDARLAGQLTVTGERLEAQTTLSGQPGTAQAAATLDLSRPMPPLSADDVVSAVLAGGQLVLPEMTLDARANIDLAALGQAVPGLLKVRADQQITAGTLELSKLAIRGGSEPAASAALAVTNLTATSGERTVRLEPMKLDLDAALASGGGLQVQQAGFESSFARVTARGSAADLEATFSADLARLHAELGRIFDLGTAATAATGEAAAPLAGTLNGKLTLARLAGQAGAPPRVELSLQAAAEGVRYRSADRTLELARATLAQTGHVTLVDGRAERLIVSEARADLDGGILATGTGWYDLKNQLFQADVELQRADLRFAATRAAGLGIPALERFAGEVAAKITAARAAPGQPVASSGQLIARNLGVDGAALLGGDATVSWTDLQFSSGQPLRLAALKLDSPPAGVQAENVLWQPGTPLTLAGNIAGSADLARTLAAVARVAGRAEPPAIAGRLSWNARCTTNQGVVDVRADGGVEQFEVGSGAQKVRQDQIRFAVGGQFDPQQDAITLAKSGLSSQPLTAELTGRVTQLRGPCVLDLAGRYDAGWDSLMAILHELVPATAETVVVAGTTGSAFQITGPLRQEGVTPAFRGLKSGLEIGWESAQLYGVALGPAKLAPALADGQIRLPPARIAAADGQVNLGGLLDFQPGEPTLKLPGTMQLLERVAVTPLLSQAVLSRFNPIFLQLADVEGRATLRVDDLLLPLGDSLKTSGQGRGQLVLDAMKVQPGGLMAELLALGGVASAERLAILVSGLDFVLQDGRIAYDNFTLTFPNEFDLRFRGSVGFDDTLELWVSLPVGATLLERLGPKGGGAEAARLLAGTRIEVPIAGTRQQPRLDLSRVDVQAMVRDALKDAPGKAAGEVLDLLRGGGQPATQPAEREPPLDALLRRIPGGAAATQPAQRPKK